MALGSTPERFSTPRATPADPPAAGSGLGTESIAELAVQWRNAYAIAEAQEQRLTTLLDGAERLCSEQGLSADQELAAGREADPDWSRRAEAIAQSFGVTAAERAANCAWVVVEELAQRLLAGRPANVREAALKFGVLVSVIQADNYEGETAELLNGFLADLTRLADAGPH